MSFKVTDDNGDVRWKNEDGLLHREDGPAFSTLNGYKSWHINGKLHREDGPAIEYSDGCKNWYLNGEGFTLQGFLSVTTDYDSNIVSVNGKRYKLTSVDDSAFAADISDFEFDNLKIRMVRA